MRHTSAAAGRDDLRPPASASEGSAKGKLPAPGDCKKAQDPVSQLVRRSSNALLELKTRLKVAQAGAPTGTAKGGAATGGTSRGSGCTAKGGTDRVGTMISGAAKGSASKITAAPGAKENSAKKRPDAVPAHSIAHSTSTAHATIRIVGFFRETK
jgi:hypothetical protein